MSQFLIEMLNREFSKSDDSPLEYRKKNPLIYNSLEVLTAIAFANKNIGRAIIDKIFEVDKIRYITAYKNSDMFQCDSIRVLPFETQIYTERAIGIIENCIQTNNYSNLELIYKVCYKKNYNQYKHLDRMREIHIMKIAEEFKKNEKVMEVNSKVLATIFVYAHLRPKDIKLNSVITKPIENLLYDFEMLNNLKEDFFNNETVTEFKDKINEFKNKIGIKIEDSTIEDMFTKMINADIDEQYIDNDDEIDIDKVIQEGVRGKSIVASDRFFNYLGIDCTELMREYTLSKRQVEEIILNVIYCLEYNIYDEKEGMLAFILYLRIFSLATEYKKLKDRYMRDVNEEHLLKIEEEKKKYELLINEINRLKEGISIKENLIKKKEKELNLEKNKLNKELDKLIKEHSEFEILKKEVTKLREIVFNNDDSEDEECINNLSVEEVIKINSLNVAVIGGNTSWIKKSKEILNNWTFIGTDSVNNDFSILKNKDLVLVNTKMSHSLYYKIKGILDRGNISYDYIKTPSNIDLSLNVIYDVLKRNNLI